MAAPSAVELRSLARIGRLRPVLIKLGLNDGPPPAEPCLETESPPSPEEPVSSLEEPVSPLEEPVSSLDEAIRQLELSELELAESTLVPEAAAVQHAVPEDVAEAVVYWLALYSRGPSEAARKINELAAKAPERVVETLLPLYQTGNRGGTARFLASLLSNEDRTVAKLCDPAASLDGSVCRAPANRRLLRSTVGARLRRREKLTTGLPRRRNGWGRPCSRCTRRETGEGLPGFPSGTAVARS